MVHVDEFILDANTDVYASWFFLLNRLSATEKDKFEDYISKYKLFCTYQNKRHRVTGASRMGDVWLVEDLKHKSTHAYDLRVDIALCTEFSENPLLHRSEKVSSITLVVEASDKKSLNGGKAEEKELETLKNPISWKIDYLADKTCLTVTYCNRTNYELGKLLFMLNDRYDLTIEEGNRRSYSLNSSVCKQITFSDPNTWTLYFENY